MSLYADENDVREGGKLAIQKRGENSKLMDVRRGEIWSVSSGLNPGSMESPRVCSKGGKMNVCEYRCQLIALVAGGWWEHMEVLF